MYYTDKALEEIKEAVNKAVEDAFNHGFSKGLEAGEDSYGESVYLEGIGYQKIEEADLQRLRAKELARLG